MPAVSPSLSRLLRSRARPSLLARLALPAVVAVLAPACSGDGGDDPGVSRPVSAIDESVLRAELAAWRARIVKDCTLDDVFPSARTGSAAPDIEPALDASLVRQRLGDGLWTGGNGRDLFVVAPPSAPSRTGFATRSISTTRDGEVVQNIQLGSILGAGGECVIRYGVDEVYRGRLWDSLPVLLQAPALEAEVAVATDDGPIETLAGAASGAGYVVSDSLQVMLDGLAPDLTEARRSLAAALDVDPAALTDLVAIGPRWYEHVELEGATAPTPVVDSLAQAAIRVGDPTVPVAMPGAGGWRTSGDRLATVRIPHRIDDRVVVTRIPMSLRLAVFDDTTMVTTLRVVGSPRLEQTGPGAAACITAVADSVAGYLRAPQPWFNSRRYPLGLLGNGSLVETSWLTFPCRGFSTDLGRDIRNDAGALRSLTALLDPGLYPYAGSPTPGDWSELLADIVIDEASLASFVRAAPTHPMVTAIAAEQRLLMLDGRYQSADDGEQRARRALFWQASILCPAGLSDAQREALVAVADGDIGSVIAGMTICPVI